MANPRLSDASGFELITGRLPDLESAFLDRVASIRRGDPFSPIDVVVGGVLQRPYLQRLIADTSQGLLNVRFSTLGELGIRLGEQRADRAWQAAASRDGRTWIRGRGRSEQPTATSGLSRTRPALRRQRGGLVGELRQEAIALATLERLAPRSPSPR